MTKSAKRGTAEVPARQPAGTESAAAQVPAATSQSAATPEPATGQAGIGDTGMASAVPPADDDAKPGIDEVKRKFREALDRKRQSHTDGQGKGGRDTGKVSGAHGPAASRRNFRRKSG